MLKVTHGSPIGVRQLIQKRKNWDYVEINWDGDIFGHRLVFSSEFEGNKLIPGKSRRRYIRPPSACCLLACLRHKLIPDKSIQPYLSSTSFYLLQQHRDGHQELRRWQGSFRRDRRPFFSSDSMVQNTLATGQCPRSPLVSSSVFSRSPTTRSSTTLLVFPATTTNNPPPLNSFVSVVPAPPSSPTMVDRFRSHDVIFQ